MQRSGVCSRVAHHRGAGIPRSVRTVSHDMGLIFPRYGSSGIWTPPVANQGSRTDRRSQGIHGYAFAGHVRGFGVVYTEA